MLLARIKPLSDTAVICSVHGFYLLTDDTCKIFFTPWGTGSFGITVVLSWHLFAQAILVLN